MILGILTLLIIIIIITSVIFSIVSFTKKASSGPDITSYNCGSNFSCVKVKGSVGRYSTLDECKKDCKRSPGPPGPPSYNCSGAPDWSCSKAGGQTGTPKCECQVLCKKPPPPPPPPGPTPPGPIQGRYKRAKSKLPTPFDTYLIASSQSKKENIGFSCDYNDYCIKNFPAAGINHIDESKCKTYGDYCSTCPTKKLICITDDSYPTDGEHVGVGTGDTSPSQALPKTAFSRDIHAADSELNPNFFCSKKSFSSATASCKENTGGDQTCLTGKAQNSSIFGKVDIYDKTLQLAPNPEAVDLNAPPSKIASTFGVCNACLGIENLTKSSVLGSRGNKCCESNSEPHMHTCPRYMLGSTQMLRALELDCLDPEKYVYGVVGHDPDTRWAGGIKADATRYPIKDPSTGQITHAACPQDWKPIDDSAEPGGEAGCGECYEIEFENSKMKRMIVQSINTSAGGGSNYDVYMPAGGYGNFNSCYPRALNKFLDAQGVKNLKISGAEVASGLGAYTHSFMYKTVPMLDGILPAGETGIGHGNGPFPWGGWGGGLRGTTPKLLTTDEESDCTGNWDVFSEKFEDTDSSWDSILKKDITYCNNNVEACNLFTLGDKTATKSAQDSCETVYNNNLHFNNPIKRVRRVQCPKNLNNVTGFKLQRAELPIVGDAAKADVGWKTSTCNYNKDTNNLFQQNYTKTTMEDCCKATCQNTTGQSPAKDYSAFYSCNKDGVPYIYNAEEQKIIDSM